MILIDLNSVHLRTVYRDYESTFEELQDLDETKTKHKRNLQNLMNKLN